MQELDDVLIEVLSDCLEAWCDDCGRLVAQGTGTWKSEVEQEAYIHREVFDHEVHVRTWLDSV